MREEKEQLRLEKERIERERALFDEEDAKDKMKEYMYDENRLNDDIDKNTAHITDLLHDKSNLTRRPYKDIEGEMDDYERINEVSHEETEEDELEVESMPEPAYGQINYFKQKDGDEQFYMKQVDPTAGGDSLLGADEMEDDAIFNLMS